MTNFLQNAIKPTGIGAVKPVAPKKATPVAPVAPKIAPKPVGAKPIAPKPITPAPVEDKEETVTPIKPPTAAPAPKAAPAPAPKNLGIKPLAAPKMAAPKVKDIVNKPVEEVTEEEVKASVEEEVVPFTKAVEIVEPVKETAVETEKAKEEEKEEVKVEEKEEKKTTKKTTRKTSKKAKEETDEETEFVPELMPQRCDRDYNEVMSETVIYSAGEEWEQQCREIDEQIKAIQITPDMNTATLKQATAELSQLRDTLYLEASTAKTIMESVESKISIVKQLNAKGSSPDERKLNSIKACMYHKVNDITVNLFELEDVARAKHNFYDSVMKQIEYKSKALITMNGGLKLEKDMLGA